MITLQAIISLGIFFFITRILPDVVYNKAHPFPYVTIELNDQIIITRLNSYGENDIDLFSIVDEAYAVSNASDALKQKATGIIGSNDEDAVAKWLLENYK